MLSAARIQRTCPRCRSVFGPDAAFCPSDGAALDAPGDGPADADAYLGTVIHDEIEIRAVAGTGAMGRVYRAHQRGIDRDVAVKILHRELSGNVSLVQRFHREAKIASRLQHPHVVEVYRAGQLADGELFIAMEYLDGMSLAAATQAAGGRLPIERALPIVLQICDAVGEGHARGIIHRDLKPENVMLVRRADTSDWVKVLDFGIAKVSLGEQSMETAAGLIFGTARYISPEGAQGAVVGPPGDVYSIAVILYQLLAGKTPFDAEQPVGMLIKHIHDPPPALRSLAGAEDVPEPIARVVMENLGKDPSRRAPSARAFGNAIAAAAKEANVSISDVGVVARMSIVDPSPVPRASGIEPTLDDAAAEPVTAAPPSAESARRTALAATTAGNSAPPEVLAGRRAEERPNARQEPAKRTALLVVLAFLLGVTLTALVMQQIAHRPDIEHEEHVESARKALANGNYVEPSGDNVRDLVQAGLAKWPDDSRFAKIRSDAAHEIVTRAMAARSGGDVVGARDLAKTAYELDPTDGTAKLLLAQYEDEVTASIPDEGGALGGPRVTLDVPIGRARPGGRAELVARIRTGAAPRHVTGAQFMISGPGLPEGGIVIPGIGSEHAYRGMFSPPREGAYDVQFEANVDGATVRADRTLSVMR